MVLRPSRVLRTFFIAMSSPDRSFGERICLRQCFDRLGVEVFFLTLHHRCFVLRFGFTNSCDVFITADGFWSDASDAGVFPEQCVLVPFNEGLGFDLSELTGEGEELLDVACSDKSLSLCHDGQVLDSEFFACDFRRCGRYSACGVEFVEANID